MSSSGKSGVLVSTRHHLLNPYLFSASLLLGLFDPVHFRFYSNLVFSMDISNSGSRASLTNDCTSSLDVEGISSSELTLSVFSLFLVSVSALSAVGFVKTTVTFRATVSNGFLGAPTTS